MQKWNMTRLLDLGSFSPAEPELDRSAGTNFLAVFFKPSGFVGGRRFRRNNLNIFPKSPGA